MHLNILKTAWKCSKTIVLNLFVNKSLTERVSVYYIHFLNSFWEIYFTSLNVTETHLPAGHSSRFVLDNFSVVHFGHWTDDVGVG
jgi:hypothetical protein